MSAFRAGCALLFIAAAPAAHAVPAVSDGEGLFTLHASSVFLDADSQSQNFVGEFERWRARVRAAGFLAVEEEALANAARTDDIAAQTDLAFLYFAQGLYPEADAAIRAVPTKERPLRLVILQGAAAVKMARWDEAVAIYYNPDLKDSKHAAAWRGLAEARRGAYECAARDMMERAGDAAPFEDQAAEYFLAFAETAIRMERPDEARRALDRMRNRPLTEEQRSARRFLEARLIAQAGKNAEAADLFADLAARGRAPSSLRAAVALLEMRVAREELAPDDALQALVALALRWRGGAFERDVLETEARLHDAAGDIAGAIAARRRLVDAYPEADAAKAAADAIRGALQTVFAEEKLSPGEAAQIFYRNIDLAPPGAEGDALIRDAAATLRALDLLVEAGELLRHQVLERLRGVDRSRVAAALADIYLQLDRPAAALDILDRTALTRLPRDVEERRRLLEAKVQYALGEPDRALSALDGLQGFDALFLRGEISASRADQPNAAAAYAAAAATGEGALTDEKMRAAIRAAAAFASANDARGLQAFKNDILPRFPEGPARQLFLGLASPDFGADAAEFPADYRAYFGG